MSTHDFDNAGQASISDKRPSGETNSEPLRDQPRKRIDRLEAQNLYLLQQAHSWARQYRVLEDRLSAIERSIVFRLLRWIGGLSVELRIRLGQWLLHSPFHCLYIRLFPPGAVDDDYLQYFTSGISARVGKPRFNRSIAAEKRPPQFSILLACHNPKEQWLREAVQSVVQQSYRNWQLVICDDASSEPWVEAYLRELEQNDPRISFVRLNHHQGISEALNSAGRFASGDFVGVLDHDDVLLATALESYAAALTRQGAELIYSDEDKIDESGIPSEPIYKPGWSPELLNSCMYLGHVLVVSRVMLDKVGWFDSGCDGAQDYDLALRVADTDPVVCHVPQVLYHWRKHPQSTALHSVAKPYAHDAGKRALGSALKRRGSPAKVEDGMHCHTYRICSNDYFKPLASLIICTRSPRLLRRCLKGVGARTSYRPIEIVVVNHAGPDSVRITEIVKEHGCIEVAYNGEFNFSQMVNLGVDSSSGDALVLLNDDVVPIESIWLQAMIDQVVRPSVGVVGALLKYRSGAVQHAGIATGIMDAVGHPHRGEVHAKYWNWLSVRREVSAVTGACLAVRRSTYTQMGGLDRSFPQNYNDVDFCLRVREAGYVILYEPLAVLRHDECSTRSAITGSWERQRFLERWGEQLKQTDHHYNPNMSTETEDGSLRLKDKDIPF